jgi:hypothetical protein
MNFLVSRPHAAIASLLLFCLASVNFVEANGSDSCPNHPQEVTKDVQFEACLAAWDKMNHPTGALLELQTVENLVWFDRLIAVAKSHVSRTLPTSRVKPKELESTRNALVIKQIESAFNDNGCGEERTWCLNRDGNPLDPRELEPKLLPGDRLVVAVFSYLDTDGNGRITIASRTIRSVRSLFPTKGAAAGASAPTGARDPSKFREVARAEVVVPDDAREIEIVMTRSRNGAGQDGAEKRHELSVASRIHYMEFGLALPFAIGRDVGPQGAVDEYTFEPEVAFTISLFPGGRATGQPLQPLGAWFGAVAGFDITRGLKEKNYYVGVDFAPFSGFAFVTGLGVIPFEYVPAPETVDDLLTDDIEPVKHYHVTFFLGLRATPDAFDTAKAAFEAASRKL